MALVSATIRTTIEAELPTDSPWERFLLAGRVAFSLWATSRMRVPPCPLAGSLAFHSGFPRAPQSIPPRSLAVAEVCATASCSSPPMPPPSLPPKERRRLAVCLLCRRFLCLSATAAAQPRFSACVLLRRCAPPTGRRRASRFAAQSLSTDDGARQRLLVCCPVPDHC